MNIKNDLVNRVIGKRLQRLRNKRGQTLVEYALILAFISVIAISVLISLGQKIKGVFTTISSQLSQAQTSH